jgi:hypothetical protein
VEAMSAERKRIFANQLSSLMKRDNYSFVVFAVDNKEKEGFCMWNTETKKMSNELAAQIEDSLFNNPELYKIFAEIMFEVKRKKGFE